MSLSRDMYLSATLRIFSCMWLNLISNRWRCCSSSSSLSLLRSRCDMMSKNSANIFSKIYRTQRHTSKQYEWGQIPADICMLKVNNRNTRMCEIGSMLIIKTTEWLQWRRYDFLMLTLKRFRTLFWHFHRWIWARKCQLGYEYPTKKFYKKYST